MDGATAPFRRDTSASHVKDTNTITTFLRAVVRHVRCSTRVASDLADTTGPRTGLQIRRTEMADAKTRGEVQDSQSSVLALSARVPAPLDCAPIDRASQLREDFRLARAARVNLLVIHGNGVFQDLLEWLTLDLEKPIANTVHGRAPGTAAGCMDANDDSPGRRRFDRRRSAPPARLAGPGSGPNAGRQHDASAPYLRVQAGAFIDRLYYRLNTVCMDVTGYSPTVEWSPLRRITARASARIAAPSGS